MEADLNFALRFSLIAKRNAVSSSVPSIARRFPSASARLGPSMGASREEGERRKGDDEDDDSLDGTNDPLAHYHPDTENTRD